MLKIASIVGRKKSGKTTLIEGLVAELAGRGLKVGVIKHGSHDFRMDEEGTDTARHKAAGASCTAIAAEGRFAFLGDTEGVKDVRELAAEMYHDCDVILTEGFKTGPFPKIEVYPKDSPEKPLCSESRENFVAFVTDGDYDAGLPRFKRDDYGKLADLVEKNFLNKKEDGLFELIVDGEAVAVNKFVHDVFERSILAILSTLKGVDEDGPGDVLMRIRKKRNG